jgi:hypothetical protein
VIVDRVLADAKAGDAEARRLYFRYLRRPPPEATFTPEPFELRPMATLQEASEEILRIGVVVAAGQLDHGTGNFLIGILRTFMEGLSGVKTEREIAAADALKSGGQS